MGPVCGTCLSPLADLGSACPYCAAGHDDDTSSGARAAFAFTADEIVQVGPYRLVARLGEGGMGEVWRAHDQRDGKVVAVKLMTALSPLRLARFRQEARAIERLRHPGIVRILGSGEGRTPWLAMALVEGRILRDAFADERFTPGWLERLQGVVGQILEALSVMHRAGIVHRDIKASNIVVSTSGRATIIDFGLAHLVDSSQDLTSTGEVVGSHFYMAPEQALGRPVDARADLYSLGALCYEVLTGRPPFLGEPVVAVLLKHVNEPPRPPRAIEPRVPPAWEGFVLRLLAKRPERRYQSAVEALEALRATAELRSPSPSPAVFSSTDFTATLHLGHAPTLVGRDGVIDVIERAVASADRGRGSLLVLAGPSGVGKSRLLDEAQLLAWRHQATFLRLPNRPGEALLPWAQVLRQAARELTRRGDPSRRALAQEALELARGIDAGGNAQVGHQSLLALLVEISRLGLVLLVVDDADRCGGAVPELLATLGREAILGSDPGSGRRGWARLAVLAASCLPLPQSIFGDRPGVRVVPLGPLDMGGIRMFLASTFPGLAHLDALTVRLAAATGGLPTGLRELCCELVAGGSVVPAANGWRFAPELLAGNRDLESAVAALELPDPVDALASRIGRLAERTRLVLERAAEEAGEFRPERLQRGDEDEGAVLAAADALVREGFLAESGRGSGEILPPSDLLRAALGRWRGRLAPAAAPAADPVRSSGEGDLATALEREAERALARNDPAAALLAAETAARVAAAGDDLMGEVRAQNLRGEALRALGRRLDAALSFRHGFDLARRAAGTRGDAAQSEGAQALLGLARLATEDGDCGHAIEYADRAIELFQKAGADAGSARARIEQGRAHLKLAEGARAERAFADAHGLAVRAGAVRDQARALNGLGRALHLQGDLDAAAGFYARGIHIEGAEADVVAALHAARARVFVELGEAEAGAAEAAHARAAAGAKLAPPLASELLALESALAAQPDEARRLAVDALAHARSCGRSDLECEALLALAAAEGGGDAPLPRAALEAARAGGDLLLELQARLALASALGATGDRDASRHEEELAASLRATLADGQGEARQRFLARRVLALRRRGA